MRKSKTWMQKSRVCFSLLAAALSITAAAQETTATKGRTAHYGNEVTADAEDWEFQLEQTSDTTSILRLKPVARPAKGGAKKAEEYRGWQLNYPVYRFCTGDVDGDGSTDALVGVVKATRFYPEIGHRIFIFKNYHGKVRPLWMGSRLGGILEDFRFVDGLVRAVERTTDGKYVVADYRWDHFGMTFHRFLARNVDKEQAYQLFTQISVTCVNSSLPSPQP